MKKHYFIHATVRHCETGNIEDLTFDVLSSTDWYSAWRIEFGAEWRLIEVLGVHRAYPDLVSA